ncbi:SMI1/KNR4 family protein [Streptomyces sp. NPDC005180]|uniref:SMI1/KNR4 family protein n=1 Tax=Streptomyces sp. NPDC005180 TaxID=3156868 RepID=UPI0033B6DBF2
MSDLKAICPPPPLSASRSYNWTDVERQVGFTLPGDYKELIQSYGQGSFARFIHVFQPSTAFPAIDIRSAPSEILETLRSVKSEGFSIPFDLESLFPVGVSDNGNYVFWRMDEFGSPDLWGIAVNEPRGERWDSFSGNLTEFLAAVLSGERRVPMFPGDLLSQQPTFDAY